MNKGKEVWKPIFNGDFWGYSVTRHQGKPVVIRRKGLTAEGLDDLYMLHTRHVILLPEHQNIFRNN